MRHGSANECLGLHIVTPLHVQLSKFVQSCRALVAQGNIALEQGEGRSDVVRREVQLAQSFVSLGVGWIHLNCASKLLGCIQPLASLYFNGAKANVGKGNGCSRHTVRQRMPDHLVVESLGVRRLSLIHELMTTHQQSKSDALESILVRRCNTLVVRDNCASVGHGRGRRGRPFDHHR